MTRYCPKCRQNKDIKDFYPNRHRSSGVNSYCKACESQLSSQKYNRTFFDKICPTCGKKFKGRKNQAYCSVKCRGASHKKPIIGYKKCLYCGKEFPYRETLKVRSYGRIGSIKQKFCSKFCSINYLNKSLASRKRTSERLKNKSSPLKGRKLSLSPEQREKRRLNKLGPKNCLWKGGISQLQKLIRGSSYYLRWRKDIFERDNYTCQICEKKGEKIQADHYPKTFAYLLEKNNIKTLEQAINCEELWNISNGRTLCIDCHKKTDTYLNRKIGLPPK